MEFVKQNNIKSNDMKKNTQPANNVRHHTNEAAQSFLPAGGAVIGFRRAPATEGERRTAKRPVSQHPELRHKSPNPGKASLDVADGSGSPSTPAFLSASDFKFPDFCAIALRRDEPLKSPDINLIGAVAVLFAQPCGVCSGGSGLD
jgi:hypothetical protein